MSDNYEFETNAYCRTVRYYDCGFVFFFKKNFHCFVNSENSIYVRTIVRYYRAKLRIVRRTMEICTHKRRRLPTVAFNNNNNNNHFDFIQMPI